jgi:hypothetical protein
MSKIPSKGKVKLGVRGGDSLVRELEGDAVQVRQSSQFDVDWHRALVPALAEWDTAHDHENFDDL